jgi:(R)-2-hydroxyacyl-CoA dehydratese activating ATPase
MGTLAHRPRYDFQATGFTTILATIEMNTTLAEPQGACFVGLDLGASRTKVAVIDAQGQLLCHAVRKSGIDFTATAKSCLDSALEMAGMRPGDIAGAVSTGYGRGSVGFITDLTKTEIGCLARGSHHSFAEAITIIDIGGQDNKIIKIDAAGRRLSFKMNRKCAAGTGAFLEEMANRLDVSLEAMNALASQAREMIKLGSFCTVFSATEVLENIRAGRPVTDIVKGLFYSVIRRVLEMDSLTEQVVMTGGVVAHNPYLVEMTAEMTERPVRVAEFPQFVGALGAALFARDGTSAEMATSDHPTSTIGN